MTTQDAYEQIRNYFRRYDAVLAKDAYLSCKYRTDEGRKCAVGVLIPDGLYAPRFENTTVDILLQENAALRGYLYDVDKRFLKEAQRLHDVHANDTGQFVTMLDLLARAYGLKASAVI